MTAARTAKVERKTRETEIVVEVNLDGTGKAAIDTPLPFLSHMLDQIARLTDDLTDDEIRETAEELERRWSAVRASPAFLPTVVLLGLWTTMWLLTRAF